MSSCLPFVWLSHKHSEEQRNIRLKSQRVLQIFFIWELPAPHQIRVTQQTCSEITPLYFPGRWRSLSHEDEEGEEERCRDRRAGGASAALQLHVCSWTCSPVTSGSCSQVWSAARKTPQVQKPPVVLSRHTFREHWTVVLIYESG